jgi:hypothetical protein
MRLASCIVVCAFLVQQRALLVFGQSISEYCQVVESISYHNARVNRCGCSAEPARCSKCDVGRFTGAFSTVASCTSSCTYCDPTRAVCGTVRWFVTLARIYPVFKLPGYDIYSETYTWSYSKGGTGSVEYKYDSKAGCTVKIGDKLCKSCTTVKCGDNATEPRIDCTNLESGAVSSPCTDRRAGGIVSLNDTALNTSLAALMFPYWGCQQNTTSASSSLPPSAPSTPTVPTAPTSADSPTTPATAPSPTTPATAPSPTTTSLSNRKCGLLRLGLFCPMQGCGLIGRILGQCQKQHQ